MDIVHPAVRRAQADAATDREAFWADAASMLPWLRPWDNVFEAEPPSFRWFVGGETNIANSCLDHHVARGAGGRSPDRA